MLVASDSHSTSLAYGELVARVDDVPLTILNSDVKPLDGVQVLLGLVVNTAEHIHDLVCEAAGRVVMASNVEVSNFPPEVHINVVDLTLGSSIFMVHSRASDH